MQRIYAKLKDVLYQCMDITKTSKALMLQTNANMLQWYQKINLHEPSTVTALKWWFTVMQIRYNYVTLELTWISNTTCHYENFLETNLPIDFCKEFMPNWKMLYNNVRISQRHPKHWCFKLMLTCYNDIKRLTYMNLQR